MITIALLTNSIHNEENELFRLEYFILIYNANVLTILSGSEEHYYGYMISKGCMDSGQVRLILLSIN